ncbi:MAG: Gfo/Idh/MocA family oxidoreductase [Phycisphaerae bacterium]|nr:Gfo/Idh/MocA family oxidoreductase [Phycisphaerae bacterium]
MSAPREIGVGVIGLGFMGQTHVRAIAAARSAGLPCRLVAVCDRSGERLAGRATPVGNIHTGEPATLFDPAEVRGHSELEPFLTEPGLDAVCVCTYTDTHVELASRVLRAGKHVLVEKPVALRAADVAALSDLAKDRGRVALPAMCMRHWPGWDWLRDRIRDGRFGPCRSATFQRLGAGPTWGAAFYRNLDASGGAMFDLHVHDADFIYWCFGTPARVEATGTPEHLTALYRFESGPAHVVAEAAWDLAPTAGFRMRFLVNFERASVEFDLARSPALTVHAPSGSEPVAFPDAHGYDPQMRHFISLIAGRERTPRATLDDALAVTRLLEAERRCLS